MVQNGQSGAARERIKGRTRSAIMLMAQQYGYDAAIAKASELMIQCEHKGYDQAARSTIKGELSEAVTEILCLYVHNCLPNSAVSKSLCITKKGGNSNQTTEMDIVLFTPFRVYMIECKSYTGKKRLTDKCYLESTFTKKDVYGQSRMHEEYLLPYLYPYMSHDRQLWRKQPPVKLILFEMSSGDIQDLRTPEWQQQVPCLTATTLLPWFKRELQSPKYVLFDMAKIVPLVEHLNRESARNFERHVQRLGGAK